ncbi:hypothetical protein HU200_063687 [Digitaria exilis]|uniref:Bifunctional inhibitor/plant lipid transfer protein/seed storage helical domain-containing protein n=1 Tax=Digitaria exilis TaxID=1010633 RepID=A0A835A330_9POAL|nr:hypothetical protein HU200_063687 [Digitaria exilis]
MSGVISSHAVIGQCTDAEKDAILENCKSYFRYYANAGHIPAPRSLCCDKVRDVAERDMQCIWDRLTGAEQAQNNKQRVLNLKGFCKPLSVRKDC